MTLALHLRPVDLTDESERGLVFNSWLKSVVDSRVLRSVFFAGKARQITRLLPRCELVAAAFDDAPNVIAGWACFEGPTLHYVYVKSAEGAGCERVPLRRQGVARMLLGSRRITRCSHLSRDVPLPQGWTFDPFAVEEP